MRLLALCLAASLAAPAVVYAQQDLTGTYHDQQSELMLQKQGEKYEFSLLARSGDNFGGSLGVIQFQNQKATFVDDELPECELTFSIQVAAESSRGQTPIKVDQKGDSFDCGFGLGVYAGGEYKFVNKPVNFKDHELGN